MNAVMQECRTLFASWTKDGSVGGTVILKTDYRPKDLSSYTMPLLLVDLLDAPDSMQYPGGVTRVDWNFALNAYNYMPDPTIDDQTGGARNLLDVMDDIRRHFSMGIWMNTISPTLTDVLNDYCFKFTLEGISNADALDQDGLIMGKRIVFDCVGIDTDTEEVVESLVPLEKVNQVDNPPFE